MGLSVRKAQRTHSKDAFHGGAPVTVLFTVNPHCVSGGGVPYSEQWDATRAVSFAFSERGRRVTVTLSRQVVGTIEKQNPSTSFFLCEAARVVGRGRIRVAVSGTGILSKVKLKRKSTTI